MFYCSAFNLIPNVLQVKKEDKLPKNICDGCSDKLELLYQFVNTSVDAEKQLLTLLQQTNNQTMSAKSESHSAQVKQEVVEPAEERTSETEINEEEMSVSSEAHDYILQQQQLPYQNDEFGFDDQSEEQEVLSVSPYSSFFIFM